jgi:AAT family amino acid transporter
LRVAVFAFVGVEMLAMTIGEAKNPATTIPRAVNGVIWRVMIFYIGALFILMVLKPWTDYTAEVSPFVAVMSKAGISGAAGVVTFVVLASALSSCNQQIFNDSRILHGMALASDAPEPLRVTNRRFVPVRSLLVTTAFISLGIVLDFVDPEHAFTYLTSIVTVSGLWMWAVVVLCHWRYRREVAAGHADAVSYRLKGAPWVNIAVLVVVAALAASLVSSPESRLGLYVAAVWVAFLSVAYLIRGRRAAGRTS